MTAASLGWQSVLVQAVVAAVLAMAATGLGAIPVLFTRRMPAGLVGAGYSLAGGMMLSVSYFDLVLPGLEARQPWQLAIGFVAGALFFWLGDIYLEGKDWTVAGLHGAGGRRALLILGTMFVHSFPEGVAIGVGYASGKVGLGIFIALAIGIHNIPEGLAISLPLAAQGVGFWRCCFYAMLSSLPQPIAVVPSVLLLSISRALLPYGLGFAAGAMGYLVMAELLPESFATAGKHGTAWGFVAGFVLILLAQYAL